MIRAQSCPAISFVADNKIVGNKLSTSLPTNSSIRRYFSTTGLTEQLEEFRSLDVCGKMVALRLAELLRNLPPGSLPVFIPLQVERAHDAPISSGSVRSFIPR